MADEPTPMRDLQSEYTLTSDERGVSIVRYTPKLAPHLAVFPIGHQPTEGTAAPTPEWLGGPSPLVADVAVELGDVVVKQGTMFRTEGGMVNVGKQMRKRDPRDHYRTPPELIRAALHLACLSNIMPMPWVLDPGAGTGVWGEVVREVWPQAVLFGVENDDRRAPHPVYNSWSVEDYLAYRTDYRFNLIVSNPPFRMAEAFVRKAESQLARDGILLVLLRSGFLASQGRARGLFAEYRPDDEYACATRPSFTDNGKTDATEYSIFIWAGNKEGRTNPAYTRTWTWDWNPTQTDVCHMTQDAMEI